jgi:hypothetical protein
MKDTVPLSVNLFSFFVWWCPHGLHTHLLHILLMYSPMFACLLVSAEGGRFIPLSPAWPHTSVPCAHVGGSVVVVVSQILLGKTTITNTVVTRLSLMWANTTAA